MQNLLHLLQHALHLASVQILYLKNNSQHAAL